MKIATALNTLLLFFLTISVSCKISAQNNLQLCANGTANYAIVISNAPAEVKAAKTLQDYLKKISGSSFNISSGNTNHGIYVLLAGDAKRILNDNSLDALPLNEILIRSSSSNLFLIGKDSADLSNAVYEFLEKYLGCRYYTADAVYIPKQNSISIPVFFKTILYAR